MATRVSSSNLIHTHLRRKNQFGHILNSATASVAVSLHPPPETTLPEHHPIITTRLSHPQILNLQDADNLFSSVPTAKLLKSTATLKLVSLDPIVDLGLWIMRSKLVDIPVIRDVIFGITNRTFYEQFVAGENIAEMTRTVRRLSGSGLRAMLVYGSEHAHENASCDNNFHAFLESVESTTALPSSSVSCVIVKMSAIYPIRLLERMSDLLRWDKRNPSSMNLQWKLNTLPIFASTSPLYHTRKQPDPLTPEEERDLELGNERFLRLCQRCAELDVPLTVDAEETTVQPAIDYLTYSSAIMFNSGKRPIVFGTIQAYLKDARERVLLTVEAARKMGVPMGFKLVRGAYMSFESRMANSLGYDSPIHNNIQETHDCYNDCAEYLMDRVVDGSGAVVLATHNVESGRMAASRARSLGIGKENDRLQFAQLYGMSDALSFGLSKAGFQVSKYLTFGVVEEVMPYLLRRAEENRGVLSSSALDRELMWKELKRRFGMKG